MDDYKFVNFDDSMTVVNRIGDVYQELNGRSFSRAHELAVLYELARGACTLTSKEDGCILDCGTWFGKSAVVMAQGLKESRIYNYPVFTIDNYAPDKGILEHREMLTIDKDFDWIEWQKENQQPVVFRSIVYRLELADYIVQTISDSVRYLKLFNLPVRLAFIDSSHDIGTCYNEALLIKELLVPGGVIVFHDRDYWQVDRVLKELIPDDNYQIHDRLVIWTP